MPLINNKETLELANLRLGWLNYLQGKYNKSIEYYTNALDYNSKSIDANLGLTNPTSLVDNIYTSFLH